MWHEFYCNICPLFWTPVFWRKSLYTQGVVPPGPLWPGPLSAWLSLQAEGPCYRKCPYYHTYCPQGVSKTHLLPRRSPETPHYGTTELKNMSIYLFYLQYFLFLLPLKHGILSWHLYINISSFYKIWTLIYKYNIKKHPCKFRSLFFHAKKQVNIFQFRSLQTWAHHDNNSFVNQSTNNKHVKWIQIYFFYNIL